MIDMAKFRIVVDKEQVQALWALLEFANRNSIYEAPECMTDVRCQLREIKDVGCSKHGVLCERFETAVNEHRVICPKCAPEEYAALKAKCPK